MTQFNLVKIPSGYIHENEQTSAFFYSKDYEFIFGTKMKESKNQNRYLRITHGGIERHPIYLQYRSIPGINQGEIALCYEYFCRLSARDGDAIDVKPALAVSYHWYTSNILSKITFITSLVALALTIVSMLICIN